MSSTYKSKPVIYSIIEIDPMNVTSPPEFIEFATQQAMINLNVTSADLVCNSNKNLTGRSKNGNNIAMSEKKRLETIQKIVDERNRILNSAYQDQTKEKKRKNKKKNGENSYSSEEAPSNSLKNPRFAKNKKIVKQNEVKNQRYENVQKQNVINQAQAPKQKSHKQQNNQDFYYDEEDIEYDESQSSPRYQEQSHNHLKANQQNQNKKMDQGKANPQQNVFDQSKAPKRTYDQNLYNGQQNQALKQKNHKQKNNQDFYSDDEDIESDENQNLSKYQGLIHPPQEPISQNHHSKRFRPSQNQVEDYVDDNQIDSNTLNQQENGVSDFLYPDEAERREKDEKLLRDRQKYDQLKKKKWDDYLKEQKKRQKLLYRQCNVNLNELNQKRKNQNKKVNESTIQLTSRRARISLEQQQQNEFQRAEEELNNQIEQIQSQQVHQPASQLPELPLQDHQESPEKQQQQFTPQPPAVKLVRKKRRRRVKRKVSKKKKHQKDANADANDNEVPPNLIESAKNQPKIRMPNSKKPFKAKKWNGRSKIPRFIGSQEITT